MCSLLHLSFFLLYILLSENFPLDPEGICHQLLSLMIIHLLRYMIRASRSQSYDTTDPRRFAFETFHHSGLQHPPLVALCLNRSPETDYQRCLEHLNKDSLKSLRKLPSATNVNRRIKPPCIAALLVGISSALRVEKKDIVTICMAYSKIKQAPHRAPLSARVHRKVRVLQMIYLKVKYIFKGKNNQGSGR